MRLPTIKIQADNEHGFMIINESDYDKEKHAIYKVEAVNEVENIEVELITKKNALTLSFSDLRIYAKQFGVKGRSPVDIIEELDELEKFFEEEAE